MDIDFSRLSQETGYLTLKGSKQNHFNNEVVTIQCTVLEVLKFLDIDPTVQRKLDEQKVSSIGKSRASLPEARDFLLSVREGYRAEEEFVRRPAPEAYPARKRITGTAQPASRRQSRRRNPQAPAVRYGSPGKGVRRPVHPHREWRPSAAPSCCLRPQRSSPPAAPRQRPWP